jgi:hypothetical protein
VNDAAPEPPVAPELFDRLTTYAEQLASKGLDEKKPLKRDAMVVVFCQAFFQQFFEYAFHHEITSVDAQAKVDASRLRIAAEGNDDLADRVAIVRSFEDLCDLWPDVLGFSYGGLSTEFKRFHTTFIPRLLGRIIDWLKNDDFGELAARATRTHDAWREAVEKL